MKEASEILYSFLTGLPDVAAAIGDGGTFRLYPAVAPEGTAAPFMIYNVSTDGLTKDGGTCSGLLSFYFPPTQYTEMITLADSVKESMNDSRNLEAGAPESGYSKDYDTMVTYININII